MVSITFPEEAAGGSGIKVAQGSHDSGTGLRMRPQGAQDACLHAHESGAR